MTTSPGGDLVEAGEHPQQRGLAAAGRAEDDQQLAVGGLQGDVAQHRRPAPDDGHPSAPVLLIAPPACTRRESSHRWSLRYGAGAQLVSD